MPQRAYFVIADITGYTAFLVGSELEHAQDILKGLFNALLDNIKAPLQISNYQGDAILTYAPEGSFVQGQTLLEAVENLYCAFAQTKEFMRRNTTCTCQACTNIPKLDLKMFVHHGEYVTQDMRGKEELSGPDVILVHRMMKNRVREETGLVAYTLFSEAAIQKLELQEFTCEMKAHAETYEHIGEVKMFAYCLKTMWEREREKRRDVVEGAAAMVMVEADYPYPQPLVWDYMNEPERQGKWMGVTSMSLFNLNHGRKGVGTQAHCVHSKGDTTDMDVTDWRPFDYVTYDMVVTMGIRAKITVRLAATPTGTHVMWIIGKPYSPHPLAHFIGRRLMYPMLRREFRKIFSGYVQPLRAMLDADHAALPRPATA